MPGIALESAVYDTTMFGFPSPNRLPLRKPIPPWSVNVDTLGKVEINSEGGRPRSLLYPFGNYGQGFGSFVVVE